jgi:hypothetical protein
VSELASVTYKRALLERLLGVRDDVRRAPEVASVLVREHAPAGDLHALGFLVRKSRLAFCASAVDADARAPRRRWSAEELEAAHDNVVWLAVYHDALHGCAVAADLRRGVARRLGASVVDAAPRA